MEAILSSTEDDFFQYAERATEIAAPELRQALAALHKNRTFEVLPAACLEVALFQAVGPTQHLGALTAFRGGRIQWLDGSGGTLTQDWQTPHMYTTSEKAIELFQALLGANLIQIRNEPWKVGQTKLCPICGYDLSNRSWWPNGACEAAAAMGIALPPLDAPYYDICGGCGTEFGVDWAGASFGEIRRLWLEMVCPWWGSEKIPDEITANVQALGKYQQLESNLLRTPTDHPWSAMTRTSSVDR